MRDRPAVGGPLRLGAAALLLGAVFSLFAPLPAGWHWPVATLLAALALAVLIQAWTYTPDGRLDYRAAMSLHLLSFNASMRPDKDIDFRMKIPANLLFAIDNLLPRARMHAVEDVLIQSGGLPGLPARIYRPNASQGSRPPLIVYFHGGGFVLGSVAMFDPLARVLAQATGCMVLSVDYRLAPRHPFPAAVDDAFAATAWAAANAGRLGACADSIFVAGDSAGANLAAVTCLRARDAAGPVIAGQILYYPAVDLRPADGGGRLARPDDYGLPSAAIESFILAYRGREADLSHPLMSPVLADDVSDLPPAFLVTAGFDPLADRAIDYGARLESAGVLVDAVHVPEMIHGFMSTGAFPQRRSILQKTSAFVEKIVRQEVRRTADRSKEEASRIASSG